MAFVRHQGDRVQILHSRRTGKHVRHVKLHEFADLQGLREVLDSPERWELLCRSIEASQITPLRLDRDDLRRQLDQSAKTMRVSSASPRSPLAETASQLLASLQGLRVPLTPQQRSTLSDARQALQDLAADIPQRLKLLGHDHGGKQRRKEKMNQPALTGSAERLFDRGLDCYERGEWTNAKNAFLAGLDKAPQHVDLLVHAGLCEEIDQRLDLALNYYVRAADVGRKKVDALIKKDPGFYVTSDAKKRRVETMTCRAPKEHDTSPGQVCEECVENYFGEVGSFRAHLDVRPFLRAVHNQALVQMKLGRFEEALDQLEEYTRYEDAPGTDNLKAQCYLEMGQVAEAERHYRSLLWASACYERAFIVNRLSREEEAISLLTRGVFWNHHMADMLLGIEKPEKIRYISNGGYLPDRLRASEFFHEEGGRLRRDARFLALVRLVRLDSEIAPEVGGLNEQVQRREQDRNFRMDRHYWDLMTGNPDEKFVAGHARRLLKRLQQPGTDQWLPKAGDILKVELLEAKLVNWRVRLVGHEDAVFYIKRPTGEIERPEGDRFSIRVEKAWRHRKSVFITCVVAGSDE